MAESDKPDKIKTRSSSSSQLQNLSSLGMAKADNEPRNCGKCNRIVREDAKAVCCEYCAFWFHVKCEGISDEVYKFLNGGGDQVHWFCKGCNNKALDVMKLVQGLKERNDELEAKLEEVSNQVNEIALVKGSFADKIREISREEVHEAREKELRECNVVISNVKEPDLGAAGDPDQASLADGRTVDQLIHGVLGASDVNIVSTTRVPKFKRQGDTYNRKLVVKLGSVNQKHKILRIAKRLRDKEDWQGVYINPDLTVKERKKDYELRSELKRRREGGETNLILSRGRIVTKSNYAGPFLSRGYSPGVS